MKKGAKLVAAAIAAVLIAGGIAGWRRLASRRDGSLKYKTAVVAEGSIEGSVVTTGYVAPLNRVELKPPTSGRIDALLVQEGDAVRQGQVVAKMSSTSRAAILDAARALGPAEYKKWQDAYNPTPIVAPISGVIILKNVVVGQTINQDTVVYAMADKLIVIAQVDESDIGNVKLGQPARVALDSYPNRPVEGRVFDILYEGTNVANVITYNVKIAPFKTPPFFRSQMTANISIIYKTADQALLIPSVAVKTGEDQERYVLVPGPEGAPERRPVEIGIEGDAQDQVLSGLAKGETVIVSKKYVPQKETATSPLSFGRKKK
jgi:macrolide-specific efflux system membrane fusion protein